MAIYDFSSRKMVKKLNKQQKASILCLPFAMLKIITV